MSVGVRTPWVHSATSWAPSAGLAFLYVGHTAFTHSEIHDASEWKLDTHANPAYGLILCGLALNREADRRECNQSRSSHREHVMRKIINITRSDTRTFS